MRKLPVVLLTGFTLGLLGCERSTPPEVVVYVALDRNFAEPILADFTRQTGIAVRAVYDTEATKTVGLTNRLIAEAGRPRCDVFWNNEILNTLRLQQQGLLQASNPQHGADIAAPFRDPGGQWFGFAARARVLIVNTQRVPADKRPTSIRDLADPAWRGQIGIAKPLFGTTASHIACLYAQLGEDEAQRWLTALRDNDVQVTSGNKSCAELVGRGALAFGLTDTDDALLELDAGNPVQIVFPDCHDGQLGTLLLPNTVALITGAPHAAEGRRLIDFLLSPEVEAALATGPSGQIPLLPRTPTASRAAPPADAQWMRVNFNDAARLFTKAAEFVQQDFLKE